MFLYKCVAINGTRFSKYIYQDKHNVPYEIAALKYNIMNYYNLSML